MSLQKTLFNRINEDWSKLEAGVLAGFIRPKVVQDLGGDELANALDRKLRIKFGIDPTSPQIHLGHIVPMLLLSVFQKAGHHIDFIVGDFTAMVGDPSGREAGRTQQQREEIEANMEGFVQQAGRYLDFPRLDIHHNSKWLKKVKLDELFFHLQRINTSTAMQREDFRKRSESGNAVSLAELLYGILMGFDSIQLQSDVEIGGVDQLLNIAQCREMMGNVGQKQEIGLFTPIIEGTDGTGRKMSKSYNNTIPVECGLQDKFGKVMSIPDKLIESWFKAFTYIHESEIPQLVEMITTNPLEAKKVLATLVVALETKDLDKGLAERERFESLFSKKEISLEDCLELKSAGNVFDSLRPSFSGSSELRRLFSQGAVRTVDGKVLQMEDEYFGVVRVGKRRFFNIVE